MLSRGISTKPPPAIRGRRLFIPLSGVGEPNPAWHGWLSLPRDEVEECGWAWRISLRDMHPTEGAIRFAGRASEVEENAWDLANIADRYFSSRGNP